ncbi:MAG: MFS transporter [Salinisphaera sp.]|uniref:MFS transporter n=1 Tax=Salinisphaera sp. TaxID=1914330 RepID=UPI003C7DDDBD
MTEVEATAPLTRRRVCGTLTFLANGFGMGVWSIEIARVQSVIGASDAEIGFALLVFAVAALCAMPVAARLATRFRINRVVGAFGVAFAVALSFPGWVSGLAGLCLALLCLGVAHGSLDVVMNSRASVIETAYGRPIMSSFHAAWSIGGAVGAGTAGLLTGQGLSAATILTASAAVVLGVLLASAAGGQGPIADAPPPRGLVPANPLRRLAAVNWSPRLIGLCLIAFFALLTEGALANWTSIYLKGVLTGLAGGFSLGYLAFSVGMSIGRLSGDRVVAACGRRAVGWSGAAVSALAFAVVLWWPSLIAAVVCFVIIGLGMSNVVPITFSTAGRTARSASRGIALAASAGYSGLLVGPALVGGLADLFTLPQALVALVASMAAIAVLATFALER